MNFSFKIDSITLDPDPNWAKILDPDPDPISMYSDPQHWTGLTRTLIKDLKQALVYLVARLKTTSSRFSSSLKNGLKTTYSTMCTFVTAWYA